jgi:hypothetical protein
MGLDMHQLIAKPGMGPSLFGDMSVGQYVVSSPPSLVRLVHCGPELPSVTRTSRIASRKPGCHPSQMAV